MKLPRLLSFGRSRRPPAELVLYTRPSCPLCDEMKAEVLRLGSSVRLREVDVERDPDLERRYGLRVPVLERGGRVLFAGRLSAERLRAALDA